VIDGDEIEKRFNHHPPTGNKVAVHENVRSVYRQLAHDIAEALPDSREKSLAFTALEESLMWANAAIARNDPTT
jgi:hypothetical protein